MANTRRTGPSEPPSGTRPFWEDPLGLDIYLAHLLRGAQTLYLRLRFGQAYEIPLAALGFAGPGQIAGPDPKRRGIVLLFVADERVELSVRHLLSVADPAYREAVQRAAAAPKPVGARIRAHRVAARKTARALAAACGMAPANWARLEASRHSPRLATLERAAAALGLTVADLLGEPS